MHSCKCLCIVSYITIIGQTCIIQFSARSVLSLYLKAEPVFLCVQRRRTAEDELNMRTVYAEGDLISVSMLHLPTAHCQHAVMS